MVAANRFPAYVDLVRRQLARDYPKPTRCRAPGSVMTGMSPSAQAYAEGAVTLHAQVHRQRKPPAAAGGAGAHRRARRRRARGGRQPHVLRARLQPRGGSAAPGRFAAEAVRLPAGAGAAGQMVAGEHVDDAGDITLDRGKRWSPDNSDGRSHGSVRLLDALRSRYNRATVRVGMGSAASAWRPHPRSPASGQGNPSLILGRSTKPVCDGAAVPVPRLRWRDPTAARGARRARPRNGKGAREPLRQAAAACRSRATPSPRASSAPRFAVRGHLRHRPANWSPTASAGLSPARQDRHQQRQPRQLVRQLDRDHLAVIWVGNDQNQKPACTARPARCGCGRASSPAERAVGCVERGLDWRWDHFAQHRRRLPGRAAFAFVARFAPAYQPAWRAAGRRSTNGPIRCRGPRPGGTRRHPRLLRPRRPGQTRAPPPAANAAGAGNRRRA